ncbi:hypothetical protein HDU93_009446 [Gonapodya sp. JEL0774]|nr:hypothetical protein HDU93_009446 [Gonapodya sp. JEL0774]
MRRGRQSTPGERNEEPSVLGSEPPEHSARQLPPPHLHERDNVSQDLRTELQLFLDVYIRTQRSFVRSLQWFSFRGTLLASLRQNPELRLVETVRPLLLMTEPELQGDVAIVAGIIWSMSESDHSGNNTPLPALPRTDVGSASDRPAMNSEAVLLPQFIQLFRTFELWRINFVREIARNMRAVREVLRNDAEIRRALVARLHILEQDALLEVRNDARRLLALVSVDGAVPSSSAGGSGGGEPSQPQASERPRH